MKRELFIENIERKIAYYHRLMIIARKDYYIAKEKNNYDLIEYYDRKMIQNSTIVCELAEVLADYLNSTQDEQLERIYKKYKLEY